MAQCAQETERDPLQVIHSITGRWPVRVASAVDPGRPQRLLFASVAAGRSAGRLLLSTG
jgi:hypothetical protein